MTEPREDRRVRRTHRMLKQGLAELMQEKDFKDITVKDITDRVDINRGTFYMHYTGIYDLLERLENETLLDFQQMLDAYRASGNLQNLHGLLTSITDYIAANAEICRSLFQNRASTDFTTKFQQLIRESGTDLIHTGYPAATDEALGCFFSFVTYGMIGLIKRWLDTGMRMEKQALVLRSERLIAGAAGSLLPI
ncbi:TetR/AcrR family transcriptional regulator [Intestinibacillus massiliensis]|uniref:TetR/AcrR family transcriptional regulator n=1 Tax=Intestinibacillus massiliensis TaxID=1871029 RepID=UPI000B361C53|nr:TetR-like C-terminal domain-containing protein [Intestinibacillus massiliensis]